MHGFPEANYPVRVFQNKLWGLGTEQKYRPASSQTPHIVQKFLLRLHRLAEINSLESIPGRLKSLKILAMRMLRQRTTLQHQYIKRIKYLYTQITKHYGKIYQLKFLRLCASSLSANVCKYGRYNSTRWGACGMVMYLMELLIFLGQQCHFPVLGIKIGQLLKRDCRGLQ